ncbi:hypothetical protein K504DRAFT_463056 [Pleomassaria siparia CBS 279.74]|uniref:Ribonuclease H1 N-terminal domain-containing protein n=1 Tax=Pleomassaria siparia CBS 279.74 TaxID=1314801 RepID=A0A6G1JUT4_9PLEO|nr:hypothetical protein K504DRAFT_463056 [Pleomassaria siparia CBS 279.74]
MGRKKNNEYYAVISGRIDTPTIFSSWGDVHPRVTGCESVWEGFFSRIEAELYMRKNGVSNFETVIKDTALNTTPVKGDEPYYAVANGSAPGIKRAWSGEDGALKAVREMPGACHKRFRTEAQALAFIEDWKEAYAEVVRRAVIEQLDRGLRPQNIYLDVGGLFYEGRRDSVEPMAGLFESLQV